MYVVVFQEVHWGLGRQDATWCIKGWSFLVTADPDSIHSGVAMAISLPVPLCKGQFTENSGSCSHCTRLHRSAARLLWRWCGNDNAAFQGCFCDLPHRGSGDLRSLPGWLVQHGIIRSCATSEQRSCHVGFSYL